jgi:hypothetical protein
MTKLKFYTVLFVLAICYHSITSFTSSDKLISTDTVVNCLLTSADYSGPNIDLQDMSEFNKSDELVTVNNPESAANVIILIARVLIAISGAIFGIKNILNKKNNE